MFVKHLLFVFVLLLPAYVSADCGKTGSWLQVLGSGGPELDDQRASTGYLIWQDGSARILIDLGSDSLLRFEQSQASINDLDYVLLSHLHVDHSNELPALVKAWYFSGRKQDLNIYGPTANLLMPSMAEFVAKLFGNNGAYRYLSSYLDGTDDYRLIAHNIKATGREQLTVVKNRDYQLSAVPVHHGPIPALAWRVDINKKSVVFSGDMNNDNNTLTELASNTDLLVAHHAIPEGATGAARDLHMPPSVIGKIAADAKVKNLVLSHRMTRTLGKEKDSGKIIRKFYSGPMAFAEDLQCFKI